MLPFCTLSHSRKISSPPLTLPLFLLTRQILSSAVFGAPDGTETMRVTHRGYSWSRSSGLSHMSHACCQKRKCSIATLQFEGWCA